VNILRVLKLSREEYRRGKYLDICRSSGGLRTVACSACDEEMHFVFEASSDFWEIRDASVERRED
jgi:hypothetical protein